MPRGSATQAWISQAYRDLLHREVDPAGLTFFTNQIDNGLSRFNATLIIENSTEYRTDYIDSVYTQALGRHVDPAGLNYFLGLLSNGDTLFDVRARILSSTEFYFRQNAALVSFLPERRL